MIRFTVKEIENEWYKLVTRQYKSTWNTLSHFNKRMYRAIKLFSNGKKFYLKLQQPPKYHKSYKTDNTYNVFYVTYPFLPFYEYLRCTPHITKGLHAK